MAPPERFDFSRPDEWAKWIRRFDRFRCASGLAEIAEESQVHTLIYSMGDAADDILTSFELSEEDRKKYKTERDRFEAYFVKKKQFSSERNSIGEGKKERLSMISCLTYTV